MRLEIELTATATAWRATYDLTGAPGRTIVLRRGSCRGWRPFPCRLRPKPRRPLRQKRTPRSSRPSPPRPGRRSSNGSRPARPAPPTNKPWATPFFAALLGDAVWQSVRQQATGAALNLHLALPTAAPELHRLPWELLHNGQEFLCLDTQQPTNLLRTLRLPAGGGVMTPLPGAGPRPVRSGRRFRRCRLAGGRRFPGAAASPAHAGQPEHQLACWSRPA